jgi:hypothetical protein
VRERAVELIDVDDVALEEQLAQSLLHGETIPQIVLRC